MNSHLNITDFQILDVNGAAAVTGLSKSTLDTMRCRGNGPPYIALGGGRGGRVGYRACDLRDWLASRVRRSTSDAGTGK